MNREEPERELSDFYARRCGLCPPTSHRGDVAENDRPQSERFSMFDEHTESSSTVFQCYTKATYARGITFYFMILFDEKETRRVKHV